MAACNDEFSVNDIPSNDSECSLKNTTSWITLASKLFQEHKLQIEPRGLSLPEDFFMKKCNLANFPTLRVLQKEAIMLERGS